MAKISLYILYATWRAFRIACLQRGTSASKEVERFMTAQLQAWETEERAEVSAQEEKA